MSNRSGPSAILLDIENREISQLRANQNMGCLLDTPSPYGCMHKTENRGIQKLTFNHSYLSKLQNSSKLHDFRLAINSERNFSYLYSMFSCGQNYTNLC